MAIIWPPCHVSLVECHAKLHINVRTQTNHPAIRILHPITSDSHEPSRLTENFQPHLENSIQQPQKKKRIKKKKEKKTAATYSFSEMVNVHVGELE